MASTLAFGTLLSASASVVPVINHTAHASTTQQHQSAYYTYKGNAGYDAKFTLDKNFKNAIKAGNVTFNGIKIAPTQSTQTVIKSDQLFRQYDKKSKKSFISRYSIEKAIEVNRFTKILW
ncbi:immunodominant staphylococcal antigen IsaB family protein [Staphylococcus warneri]